MLHHVGVASGFSVARREEFVETLEPYRSDAAGGHPWLGEGAPGGRVPGGQSRWSGGKDLSWEPLRPELVVEVAYDHLQVDRFRHATSFVRWRPDRSPALVHLLPARHPGAHRARRRSSAPGLTRPSGVSRPATACARSASAGSRSVPAHLLELGGRAPPPRARRPRRAGSGPAAGWPGPGTARPARARSASRAASLAAPRTRLRTAGSHSADVVGHVVEGPVVGQDHRGRPLPPSGQPGEAVGRVARPGPASRGSDSGRHPELGPHAVLVGHHPLPPVELDHPLARPRTGPGPCRACR